MLCLDECNHLNASYSGKGPFLEVPEAAVSERPAQRFCPSPLSAARSQLKVEFPTQPWTWREAKVGERRAGREGKAGGEAEAPETYSL